MQTLSVRRYRLSHPNLRRVRCSHNVASDRLPTTTSTRAAWPTRNRAAFVTRTTSSLSLSSRVSFADDDHRMGIICASPSTAPSAAR